MQINIGGQVMEMKPYEIMDAFWKNWTQSLSMFSNAGKQMEHLTLETMKQQQETLQKMEEAVKTLEQEMKQYSAQLNSQYTGYVKQLGGTPFTPQIEEWQGKWNEFAQQMQQFSISPAKASVSFLSQASGQMEDTMKQVIAQNQNQREEIQKQLNVFLEELKGVQLDLVKKFEDGSKTLFSAVK
jgi:polyhydroxyalkanoic acid inclusion protein PhaP